MMLKINKNQELLAYYVESGFTENVKNIFKGKDTNKLKRKLINQKNYLRSKGINVVKIEKQSKKNC